MKKSDLKVIILQLNNYFDPTKPWDEPNWEPVAILSDPENLDDLISNWEKKFRKNAKRDIRTDEFSIGSERFRIVYATEWTF